MYIKTHIDLYNETLLSGRSYNWYNTESKLLDESNLPCNSKRINPNESDAIKIKMQNFFVFLGPHPWHMEVPRLRVKLEPQLLVFITARATPDLSCICDLHHSSRQCQVLTPLNEARD